MLQAFRSSFTTIVLCLSLCVSAAQAQTASLVSDINIAIDTLFSADPVGFTEYGGMVYFFAKSSPEFPGLWRTDGTSDGTELVKSGIQGEKLLVSGGLLYFAASDNAAGLELWKSDGTPGGTVRVKDINPGAEDGIASSIVAYGGDLYFGADDGINGIQPWKSDGTDAGTVLLKVVHDSSDSFAQNFTVSGGTLYFSAVDEFNGGELWKSDGTPGGTVLVKDIRPGTSWSSPQNLVDVGGTLFFSAFDGVNGRELWASDGTLAGTILVRNIDAGPGSSFFDPFDDAIVEFGGEAFFGANPGDGSGVGLWKSDGTLAGTVQVVSGLIPKSFAVVGGTLYIVRANISTGDLFAPNLWKSDGTTPGTVLVKAVPGDINRKLGVVGGTPFLAVGERQLWKSDGTGAGTVLVVSQLPVDTTDASHDDLTGIGGTLYFSSAAGNKGRELWKSNGTEAGTLRVKDIGIAPASSTPTKFVWNDQILKGARLFFFVTNGADGGELWRTTGSDNGTQRVKEIASGSSRPYVPADVVVLGGNMLFVGIDSVNGFELWRSDGTNVGTVMVKNIHPNNTSQEAKPTDLTLSGGFAYFRANDEVNGYELWRTDGTEAGTVMVKNINTKPGLGSEPRQLVDVNGTLFFLADDGISGRAIWKSDGTAEGTVMVKDIYPVNINDFYYEMTSSGGALLFRADDGVGGHSLWRSDGTPEGTTDILPILFNNTIESPSWFHDVDGTLFFAQHNALWKSNGTLAGTVLVRTIDPFPAPEVALSSFTHVDGVLYFISSGPNGTELWRSNGTTGGTILVKKLVEPGIFGFTQIVGTAGGDLFVSVPSVNGYQLWRSTGTTAGTKAIQPSFLSPITEVAGFQTEVYFGAESALEGNELWSTPLLPSISASGVVDAASFRAFVSPGGLTSVFGTELSGVTAAATSLPLPTTLAGVRVQVAGVDAPLLFVSPRQINFQVPFEAPIGSVPIVVITGTQQSAAQLATVATYAPATFVNPATGRPIIQRHPDGALITEENRAKPGDTLIIYVTGIGGLDVEPASGAAASDEPLSTSTVTPTVTVGAVPVEVLFAGLAPNFVGLGQINIVLPNELPQANGLPLVIIYGNRRSQSLALLMQMP